MNVNPKSYYLIHLQFLGFRYHGWQKQKDVKTVQYMLDRTLIHILGTEVKFKTMGSSRTDAMVSAQHHVSELFIHQEINPDELLRDLNKNLPQDIRAIKIEPTNKDFNIINNSKTKEYLYFFSYGEKAHPFCAPFMTNFKFDLDIEIMKEAAKFFEGNNYFKNYCYRPENKTDFYRTITHSSLEENTYMTGSFFPKKSYVFKVKGNGFLHHQVRLMVGALISLGKKEIEIADIKDSLLERNEEGFLGFIAPSSGLILNQTEFNHE